MNVNNTTNFVVENKKKTANINAIIYKIISFTSLRLQSAYLFTRWSAQTFYAIISQFYVYLN